MSLNIPRRTYADLYGPTVGDRVRLADSELIIEVERNYTTSGDEVTRAGWKSNLNCRPKNAARLLMHMFHIFIITAWPQPLMVKFKKSSGGKPLFIS